MIDILNLPRGTVLVHDMGATVTVIRPVEAGLLVELPSRPDAEGTILHKGLTRWQVQTAQAAA